MEKPGSRAAMPMEVLVCMFDRDCAWSTYEFLLRSPRREESSQNEEDPLQRYWAAAERFVTDGATPRSSARTERCGYALLGADALTRPETHDQVLRARYFGRSVRALRDQSSSQGTESTWLTRRSLENVKVLIFIGSRALADDVGSLLHGIVPTMRSLKHVFLQSSLSFDIGAELMDAVSQSDGLMSVFCWSSQIYTMKRLLGDASADFLCYFLDELARQGGADIEASELQRIFDDSVFHFPHKRLVNGMCKFRFENYNSDYDDEACLGVGIPQLLTREKTKFGLIRGSVSARLSLHLERYRDEFVQAAIDLYERLECFDELVDCFHTRGLGSYHCIESIYLLARMLGWLFHLKSSLWNVNEIDIRNFIHEGFQGRLMAMELFSEDELMIIGLFMTEGRSLPPSVLPFSALQSFVPSYRPAYQQRFCAAGILISGIEGVAIRTQVPPVGHDNGTASVATLYRIYDDLVHKEAYAKKMKQALYDCVIKLIA